MRLKNEILKNSKKTILNVQISMLLMITLKIQSGNLNDGNFIIAVVIKNNFRLIKRKIKISLQIN